MIDLFPHARATLKADTFFTTTLDGFEDAKGRFKVFIEGETPTDETPFLTIDINPGPQDQNNDWSTPFVTFTAYGTDKDRGMLWTLVRKIRDIFKALNQFAPVQSTFTANAASNTLTSEQHQLMDADIVTVTTTGTLPGGLSADTTYYVVSAEIDTLKLSATQGGAAIDLTSPGNGTHKLVRKRVLYQLMGDALFDQGQNPVTDHITASVALRFGIVE